MFTETWVNAQPQQDQDGMRQVRWATCDNPLCGRVTFQLVELELDETSGLLEVQEARTVYPAGAARPVAPDVEEPYASDFREAAVTLADSPKASAALSRRCLQALIRDKAGITRASLSKEIDDLLASGQLPSWLAENVDAVRNVGNFAAHPLKDTNTGEVVDVEPGEAEWLLDVLEGLFDFYFVQPAIAQRKRDELNQKLQSAGKPPLK
jgi:hypothetical protein